MIPVIIGAAAELLSDAIDSDNRREAAVQDSKNRRNAAIAKTLVDGAVAMFRAYQQSKADAQVQAVPSYAAPPQRAMLNPPEPVFSVIKNSIWIDRTRNEMRARVVEQNSGESLNVAYKIQSLGNKVHRIYESVEGGQWEPVGMVDWKYMRPSDLGLNETGGPIFAEIMQTAMRRR